MNIIRHTDVRISAFFLRLSIFFLSLMCVQIISVTIVSAGEQTGLKSVARKVHGRIFDAFLDTDTNLIRTRLGEGDPLEDCSLYGGFYLACLADAYDATADESLKDDARTIFSGLTKNLTVSGIPGFLARGYNNDGSYRGDSSVDQYTGVIYGFWRYFHSPLSGESEREKIRSAMNDILVRFEQHNWRITRENGDMTTFGRLHAEMPTRADRLLSFLLAGYDITGNGHWLDVYREKLPGLLVHCYGYEGYESWVLIQSQVSLRILVALESNPDIRDIYIRGSIELAERCQREIDAFRELPSPDAPESALARYYDDNREFTRTIRNPIEAVTVMLLSGDPRYRRAARLILPELNARLNVDRITFNVGIVPLEWDQWLGVKE